MIKKRHLLINSAKSIAALPLLSSCAVGGNWPSDKNDARWLAGGTKSMQAAFPPVNVPFNTDSCKLTQETGVGPCYFDNVTTADDISEGQPGVPMVVALKFVKENCEPIEEGALVEVWWADCKGVYSADISDSSNGTTSEQFTGDRDIEVEGGVPPFFAETCALLAGGNNEEALETKWFRGKKLTNADGCVYFKGCFPGWYARRAAHIHLRVIRLDGTSYDTQLGFGEELTSSIYLRHPDYTGINQDTSNDVDPWFARLTPGGNILDSLRQSDGSMVSYKTLTI
ncbi:MAG: hypothetical protein AB8B86_19270 [Pseudomonadales bacterium]